MTLPGGWTADRELEINSGTRAAMSISAWTVDGVAADPCRWQAALLEPITHEHVAGGVLIVARGLTAALAPGRRQVPVVVGGVPGSVLELVVPAALDLGACDGGRFQRWLDSGRPDRTVPVLPGQTDLVHFVDVDRSPLLVMASIGPAATARDRADLSAILASIEIDRGP